MTKEKAIMEAMIHKPLCMAYGNADDFKAVIKQLCYWTNCIYCATLVLAQNYVNVLLNTRRPQRHNKQEI